VAQSRISLSLIWFGSVVSMRLDVSLDLHLLVNNEGRVSHERRLMSRTEKQSTKVNAEDTRFVYSVSMC
jgi:hypothetical protein